jgi:transcriptional regulator with XRE-family HTH domain
MQVHENIKHLRVMKALTQQQMADEVGLGRPLVGQIETGRSVPTLQQLERFSEFFNISIDDLVKKDLKTDIGKGREEQVRILSVTVDRHNEETVVLVPQKASAGYLNGYADLEYMADLPQISLPMLKNGTFRAFEIKGDSMLPIQPGSIVVGRYVESLHQVKDGNTYVILTNSDGIVYKRLKQNVATYTFVSDNPVYASYEVDANDILEIWEAKLYISTTFPDPGVSLESLACMIGELKDKMK